MVLQDWYLVIALVVLLALMYLLIWMLTFQVKTNLEIQKVNKSFLLEIMRRTQNSEESSKELLDKTISLLAVKDPLSYQQVQVMNSASVSNAAPVDNSDHGEMSQWIEENDELTAREKELYRGFNEF